MDAEEADRRDNEIVAAGALLAVLVMEPLDGVLDVVDVVQDEAAIIVRFGFLKSRYRLTVTMEDDDS